MPKFRTKAQNSRMHGLAAQCGLSHDDLRDYAAEISNGRTDHTSELYTNEAQTIINRLASFAAPKKQVSPRTIQYRKQKTGVKTLVSNEQKQFISDLLRKRGITPEGYRSLCDRMFRHRGEPRTTAEGGKMIEALKAMNERDAAAKQKSNREAA